MAFHRVKTRWHQHNIRGKLIGNGHDDRPATESNHGRCVTLDLEQTKGTFNWSWTSPLESLILLFHNGFSFFLDAALLIARCERLGPKMHASTALPAASCSCGGHCQAWGYKLAAQPAQQRTKRQQAALNGYHRHCTAARDKRSSNVQIIPPNSSSPSSDILLSKTRQNCLASANYCLLGPVLRWDKRSTPVASQQNAFSLWCLSSIFLYKIHVRLLTSHFPHQDAN